MSNTLKFGNGQWATKEGSTLAYNDENNNFKPLPFNFERGSSATVVNKDGLIETVGHNIPRIDYKDDSEGALLLEPQRTNILPYSSDFSQWDLTRVISTSNSSISPDGNINSYKLQSNASGNNGSWYREIINSISGNYELSVFAKSGTTDFFQLRIDGVGGVVYDLSNGVVKSQSNAIGSIENYGNGWYRCKAQMTASSSTVMLILIGNENMTPQNWSSTSGNDIYLYGAQLEEGSYATSYIPTQGSVVTRLADSCYQGGLLDKGILNNTAITLFFNSTLTSDTASQFLDIISIYNSTAGKEIRIESRTNNILYVQQGGVVNSGDDFNSLNLGSNSVNFKKIAIVLTTTQFKIFADGVQVDSTQNGSYNVNFDSLSFQTFNGAVQTKIQNKEIKLYNTALSDSELIALTS